MKTEKLRELEKNLESAICIVKSQIAFNEENKFKPVAFKNGFGRDVTVAIVSICGDYMYNLENNLKEPEVNAIETVNKMVGFINKFVV